MIKFVESNQLNPYLNIAVEQWLVQNARPDCVTMYLWRNRRTVVIGMNQNPYSECNVAELEADGGFLVRRKTGGGAVYHDDGNLNFSFVAPPDLYDVDKHFAVIRQALSHWGLEVEVSGRNDLTCFGRKISGNAFSKSRSACLHHGTLLIRSEMEELQRYLKVDKAKLMKHGVESVRSRVANLSDFNPEITSLRVVPSLRDAFEEVYADNCVKMGFEHISRREDVQAIARSYQDPEWLYGRWREFRADKKGRFEWGAVELSLQVDESAGRIIDAKIATDGLDLTAIDLAQKALVGADIHQRPELPSVPHRHIVDDILSLVY